MQISPVDLFCTAFPEPPNSMIKTILLSCVSAFTPEFSHLILHTALLGHNLTEHPVSRVTESEESL